MMREILHGEVRDVLRIFVLNPHRSIDIFGGRVFYMYIYGFSICIYMMFYIIVIWPIHHYSVILLIIKSFSFRGRK